MRIYGRECILNPRTKGCDPEQGQLIRSIGHATLLPQDSVGLGSFSQDPWCRYDEAPGVCRSPLRGQLP